VPIRNLWSLESGECIVVEEAVMRFTEKVLAIDSRLREIHRMMKDKVSEGDFVTR
jgi:hypothetical protein